MSRRKKARASKPKVNQPALVPASADLALCYRWVPCWWRFDGGYFEVFGGRVFGSDANRLCSIDARLSRAEANKRGMTKGEIE